MSVECVFSRTCSFPARTPVPTIGFLLPLVLIGALGVHFAARTGWAQDDYTASNVSLLGKVTLPNMGGGPLTTASGLWGWADALTGKEYALVARSDGTSFVDVTNPLDPKYLGNMRSFTGASLSREIKVYENDLTDEHYAYVVSADNGRHGMQIIDLTQLRGVTTPRIFPTTLHHSSFDGAYNLSIDDEFAFVALANGTHEGLRMLDLSNPRAPMLAATWTGPPGFTLETQVVTYTGPDTTFAGKQIAFNANFQSFSIADLTNKSAPTELARRTYPEMGVVSHGWLSEDQRYYFQSDEIDEATFPSVTQTRMHVWNVSSLNNPVYVGFHEYDNILSTDGDLFVRDDLIYTATYNAGLRIQKINHPGSLDFDEIGYFDTVVANDNLGTGGITSVYPFLPSGNILLSDRTQGLWVVKAGKVCDFDENDLCDLADIDLLTEQGDLVAGVPSLPSSPFDINGDAMIDDRDLALFLTFAGRENGFAFYLRGDADLDGAVDVDDFTTWSDHRFTGEAVWSEGDFNGDGVVDVTDFHVWNEHKFEDSPILPSLVPEPAAHGWMGLVFLASFLRRRHR